MQRVAPVRPTPESKYEALLEESMRLFNEKGYRDTSVEEIAAAVGLPASGVYRYFARKSELLAASFRRAADWLSAEVATVTAVAHDPEDALTKMIDAYVGRSFEHPELAYVYYTERLNMTVADRNVLRSLQRSTVESWVELVVAVRPEWTAADARFAVHAAMALVVDIGRLTDYHDTSQTRAMVSAPAGPDPAGALPVANGVARQVGDVAERAEHRQASRLRDQQTDADGGLDAAVGVDVAVRVTREGGLGDALEELWGDEVRHPGAGKRQPGEYGETRILLGHLLIPSDHAI